MIQFKLIFLVHCASSIYFKDYSSILLVYSSLTDISQLERFSSFEQSLNMSSSTNLSDFDQYLGIEMIVDISSDKTYFYLLDQVSQYLNVIYLTSTVENEISHSYYRFYSRHNINSKALAAIFILNSLNWERFAVLSHESYQNIIILSHIQSSGFKPKSIITYSSDVDYNFLHAIISNLKSQNIKYIVIIDTNFMSLFYINIILSSFYYNSYGNYIFLISDENSQGFIDGSVILSDPYSPNQIFESINSTLSKINYFSHKHMLELCPNFQCNNYFDLLNVQRGMNIKVGTWSNTLSLISPIIFPGNNYESFLPVKPAEFIITKLDDYTTQLLTGNSKEEAGWYKGAEYAIERSNLNNQIIEGKFKLNELHCEKNGSDWLENCFLDNSFKIDKVFLSHFWKNDTMRVFKSLMDTGILVPQIGFFSTTLKNESLNYIGKIVSIGLDFDETFLNLWTVVKNYGWEDFIVFTTDDVYDMNYYRQFLILIEKLGVRIRNPDHYRIFPTNYSRTDFNQYKDFFEFALLSRCRIFYLLISNNGDIIEGLYDIGIKKGDAIIIGNLNIYKFLLEDIPTKYMKKRQEMLSSSILTSINEYVGEFGQEIKLEIEEKYNTTKFLCYAFDSILLLENTFNYANIRGINLEDISMFYYSFINQKTFGCSGTIIFADEVNHRKTYEVALEQLIYDKKLKKLKPKTIAVINRLSATSIRLIQSPVWFNSSATPKNYVDIGLCGFDKRDSVPSGKGRMVLALVSIAALIICALSSFFSTKLYYFPILYEEKQVVGSGSDNLFLLFFPVQTAQYLSLFSNRGILKTLLKNSIYLFAGDLFGFLNADFDLFWTLYLILLIYSFVISLSSALFAYYWKNLDELKGFLHKALIFFYREFYACINKFTIYANNTNAIQHIRMYRINRRAFD